MKRTPIIVCLLFVLGLASYARKNGQWTEGAIGVRRLHTVAEGHPTTTNTVTTTNASLKGIYVFKIGKPTFNNWGQTLTCGGNPVFVGGTEVSEKVALGTLTFDGAGNVTGSGTEYGQFDQTASNATVSCASGGNAVYDAPATGTLSGTYSIQSNGTGTVTLTFTAGGGGPPAVFNVILAGGCTSLGVSNTILFESNRSDNSVENVGIARLQQ
jgi:hypothetical protein